LPGRVIRTKSVRTHGIGTPKLAALALLAGLVFDLTGCANVAAYERGKLAHPTMKPGDAASVARDHVYAIQEGAMGGAVGASSGCGCN